MIILCGNKVDLEREVPTADGEKLALKEGLLFFEISAKTSKNVNKMFYSAIAELPFFEQFEFQDKDKLVEELGIILY